MKRKALCLVMALCLLLSVPVVSASAATAGTAFTESYTISADGPLVSYSVSPEYTGGVGASLYQIDETTLGLTLSSNYPEEGSYSFSVVYTYESEDGVSLMGSSSYFLEVSPAAEDPGSGTEPDPGTNPDPGEQPANLTITGYYPEYGSVSMEAYGSAETFGVYASADGGLYYQWALDGSDAGTGSTCSVNPSWLSSGSHTLTCTVSSGYESDSVSWAIQVAEPVQQSITINNWASSAEVSGSGTARFTVSASGKGLSYQWYELDSWGTRGVLYDGSTGFLTYSGTATSTMKVSCYNADETETRRYCCIVRDADGYSVQTDTYVLYITEDPELTKVSKIEVTSLPDRVNYMIGETLDTEGMVLTVTNANGKKEITSGFACDPMLFTEVGTQTINVSYGGKTTSFTVTVVKSDHEHQWTGWMKDSDLSVVYRICEYESCAARELYTYSEFIKQYPDGAVQMGLITEEELKAQEEGKKDNEEKKDEGKEETAADTPVDDRNTPEAQSKKTDTRVYLFILIAAVILLAICIVLYIRLYGKPKQTKKKARGDNNPYRF